MNSQIKSELERCKREREWLESNREVLGNQYHRLLPLLNEAEARYEARRTLGYLQYELGDYDAQWYCAYEMTCRLKESFIQHVESKERV